MAYTEQVLQIFRECIFFINDFWWEFMTFHRYYSFVPMMLIGLLMVSFVFYIIRRVFL